MNSIVAHVSSEDALSEGGTNQFHFEKIQKFDTCYITRAACAVKESAPSDSLESQSYNFDAIAHIGP